MRDAPMLRVLGKAMALTEKEVAALADDERAKTVELRTSPAYERLRHNAEALGLVEDCRTIYVLDSDKPPPLLSRIERVFAGMATHPDHYCTPPQNDEDDDQTKTADDAVISQKEEEPAAASAGAAALEEKEEEDKEDEDEEEGGWSEPVEAAILNEDDDDEDEDDDEEEEEEEDDESEESESSDAKMRAPGDEEEDDEVRRANCELSEGVGRCAYLSPLQLRYDLELQLQRHGERALDASSLALKAPALFWSLWWYCARLDLPLPTPPSRRRRQPFPTPTLAVAAWSRTAAFAGAAAALRTLANKNPRRISVATAAKEALRPAPAVTRLLEPVRAALFSGGAGARPSRAVTSLSAESKGRGAYGPTERVRDATAFFLDARSRAAKASHNLASAFGADDMTYRVLLRLNDPGLLAAIPTTGPLLQKHGDDLLSTSPFDHAYRAALTSLHHDGANGLLQARDEPCSERAVIFRSIFGHLY
mmetsp:Transcript_5602/g.17706  ORF Transcript_5602/g.17706 Transcript_5602/m.17706 type:complete len:479 (+) Transcript_5602:804-2240(+)